MLKKYELLCKLVVIVCVLYGSIQNMAYGFDFVEATVEDVHRAIRSGEISCEDLVRGYIERIEVYDQSTGLNSIILINPAALLEARELDEEFSRTSKLRPLHCAPLIVKDNYNTKDLQTTAGSAAMLGFLPDHDAWQVAKLREAGALVLAKSNMAEWAFSPRVTISSVAGETRNPYDLDHVPAGSSGGTAAAVAANLGLIGLGTDTGNSIRGPSSHNALVGIRSTLGLASRSGIVPLYLRNDVGGPMARTVKDAVRVLQVTAGVDPEDPLTLHASAHTPLNILAHLDEGALKGSRIGVLRQLSDREHDATVNDLFEEALARMKRLGAILVDPVNIDDLESISSDHWCRMFRQDLNHFLETNASRSPRRSLREIVESGRYSEYIAEDLKGMLATDNPATKGKSCEDMYRDPRRVAFRKAVVDAMDSAKVVALVYPSWNFPPARIGHPEEYRGDNSQIIAPHTGLPAVTVPMGYVDGLPAGLQFLGRLYSERDILRLVYAWEQATKYRKPPDGFGELSVKP